MKKRIFSLLLCFVLVAGLLPAQHVHADEDWEEGDYCDFCGEYIYGDWVCNGDGHHCGEYSDHYDCYEENHCGMCGQCFYGGEEYICAECGAGPCCVYEGEYCVECGLCIFCVGEICWNCGRCVYCTATNEICEYCGMCYDDDCGGMCSEGADHLCLYDHDGYACESCGKCTLTQDGEEVDIPLCNQCRRCEECIEKCSAWDGENHNLCLECHDDFDYCPDCHYCWLEDIISDAGKPLGCMDCGRCIDCIGEICESCGNCFECVDQCDRCGKKCLDCHEEEGKICETCGQCFQGVGRCKLCGNCWECTSGCPDCGLCISCHEETHCAGCDACAKTVDLCEGCGRCPDCTEYCEDCKLCAHCEEDNHCSVCYDHTDPDALCSSCGACGDCADLCEECGVCMDCADETDHCSECGACGIACPDCGMCDSCAVDEGQHCGDCKENCFENVLYCEFCQKCVECIDEENYCFDCYQCKSHHVGGKCDGKGSHTHKLGDWVSNASHHWKECRLCKNEQSKASHVFNSEMICTVCGYDATEPITIMVQPRDVRAKVSDINADLDDPLCPNNNHVSFRVEAKITDKALKGTLSYQWYIMSWDGETASPLQDHDDSEEGHGIVSGAKTPKLITYVDWECEAKPQYFCRITLTSPEGEVLASVDSDTVELKISHVYNQCEPVNDQWDYALNIRRDSGKIDRVQVHKDDGGHKDYCCGEAGEEHANPMQEIIPHNFDTPVTVNASKDASGFEEYYQYTCLDCGAVRYVKKHEHSYELVMDFAKPETITFVETYCTNHTHPLRCTVEGCTAVSHEKHSFIPKVYAPPEPHDNGTVTPGRYSLECWQCGYTIGGRELYEANNNTHWDTFRTLISADFAAVEVEKTYGDFGFGTFCLAVPGDTVNLIPHQKDGKKVVGWTNNYTDYTTKYSGGEHDGEYLTASVGLEYHKDDDGTWWFVMPYENHLNSYGVHGAGWMHFTPKYAECNHENGTKLANQVDAVCMNSGYTGDEVCVDCGQIIGKVGDFIPAPSDGHTGEWELIEGTAVEASCEQKGYTGDYRCSDCGEIKPGENLGYKHGLTRIKNTTPGTCVTPAYTGDIYCTECHEVIVRGKTLSLDESNHAHTHTDLKRAATCVRAGSTGYTICDDCGKTLSTPKPIPALGHVWDEGTVTEAATQTSPGTKTYHCTREGCNKTRTETIPSLSASVMESVALTVTAPAAGKRASAAATTETAYTIANTSWLDELGDDVALGSSFADNTTYIVRVELEAVEPNAFAAETLFTVNGQPATVVTLGTDSVTLRYTFPPFGGSTTPPTPVTPVLPAEPVAPVKPAKPENPFVDVIEGAYYENAVLWAAANGITGGVDALHFAPDAVCTRAYAVTFLWRAAGCPAPESTEMPFTDVVSGSYYHDAVLWAVENGITKGTSATTFCPDAVCTRAEIATFLWRSQKRPAAGSANPFTDVSAEQYYCDAVLWAVENGITKGTSATSFSPNAACTRAQIVTFLYRCMN